MMICRKLLFICRLVVVVATGLAIQSCITLPDSHDDGFYSISGSIVEPNNSVRHMMAGVDVKLKDKTTGSFIYRSLFDKNVEIDTLAWRYSFKDIPSGDYEVTFSGQYYKNSKYDIVVKGDVELDVVLIAKNLVLLYPEELYFGPEDKYKEITLANICQEPINIHCSLGNTPVGLYIFFHVPDQPEYPLSDWTRIIPVGGSLKLKVECRHYKLGTIKGGANLHISTEKEYMNIYLPIEIETTLQSY